MAGGLVEIYGSDDYWFNLTVDFNKSPPGDYLKEVLTNPHICDEYYGSNTNTRLLIPMELL